jgi:crotonobetainyl-CoA:carnitine CoA-transferase CaiB-like acyl-CoA transferase
MSPALEGVRILDMTQYEAGTSCTQYLGWLGADVVKIEGPTGDPGRYTGRGMGQLPGDPQYFLNYNANKRSVVLDLKSERGRQLFFDLVPHFDAFVENYGPGVIESLDIGYERLRELNPRLIYGRLKGFGLSGPYKDYKSFDWVAQASAGTFSATGEPDGPPTRPAPTMADSGTGIQMALAILAAYIEVQRTGEGQLIEISMQEAVTMFMRTLGLATWGVEAAPRTGLRQGGGATGTYPCKGDGPNDWVFIMPATTRMWDALCAAIGSEELLLDERYASWQSRVEHRDEVYELIASWTRRHDKREVMQILGEAGVPCSYVFDTLDLFTDPHLTERGLVQDVEHPVNGTTKLMRMPVLMEGAAEIQSPPLLGEHTDEVLGELLGLDEDELAALRQEGVTNGELIAPPR